MQDVPVSVTTEMDLNPQKIGWECVCYRRSDFRSLWIGPEDSFRQLWQTTVRLK